MGSTQHILSSAVTLVGDREPFRHERDSGKVVQRAGWGRSSSRRTTAYGSGTEGPSLARSAPRLYSLFHKTQEEEEEEEEEQQQQQVRVALSCTCYRAIVRIVPVTERLPHSLSLSLSLSLCTGSDVSGARVRARVCLRRAFLPGPEGFPKKKLGSSLVLASINTDVHNFFEGRSLFLSLGRVRAQLDVHWLCLSDLLLPLTEDALCGRATF